MSTEKKYLNSRIQHKHDTEENWNKATNFIPLQAEIIIYDVDNNYYFERVKIGDGVTPVTNLPFYMIDEVADLVREIELLASQTLTLEYENNTLLFNKGINLDDVEIL